jgi:predicted RNase H-like HicB family nuclease
MLKKLTATLEKGEGWWLAFCPEIPEGNGQGRTKAEALEDLAQSIAFLLQCEWEDSFGITDGKIKRAKDIPHEARGSDSIPKSARLRVSGRRRKPLEMVESR